MEQPNITNPQMRGTIPKTARSEVWKYFRKTKPDEVQCTICIPAFTLKYTSSTTQMMKHINETHPLRKDEHPAKKQRTLELEKRSFPEETANQLKRLITKFLVEGLLPFNIVSLETFADLMNFGWPGFEIPHRTTFSDSLIPEYYAEIARQLKDELDRVDWMAITTDGWSSISNNSYMTITSHYLTDDMYPRSKVLVTFPLPESHTGRNISNAIERYLKEWGCENKITAAVTDNANNVVHAIRMLGFPHIPCFAHTLQLAIADGLNIPAINSVIEKAKKLVGHFNHSNLATAQLSEIQREKGQKEYRVIQSVPTRWNSTFFMLNRLIQLKVSIATCLSESNCIDLNLNDSEWDLITKLSNVLNTFHLATKLVEGELSPTLSLTTHLVNSLKELIAVDETQDIQLIKQVKWAIAEQLNIRWRDDKRDKIALKATFFDIRFKNLTSLEIGLKNTIFQELRKEWQDACATETTEASGSIMPAPSRDEIVINFLKKR